MESLPGMGLGGLGFYVTVWVVMMAAMIVGRSHRAHV